MTESTNLCRKKICFVATVPFAIHMFLRAHINILSNQYDITIITNTYTKSLLGVLNSNVRVLSFPIERKISLRKDLVSLIKLWRFFKKEKFDCVHSITPKAGLLSMIAGRFARIPLRLHTFTGQVWITRNGFKKIILKFLDKLLVKHATQILTDSHSQRLFLIKNKIVKSSNIKVLGDGSIAGVDINRFKYSTEARREIRLTHQIPDNGIVFLFLGRLNRDKGLIELFRAFAIAAKDKKNIYLLIVGPDEENFEIEIFKLQQIFPGRIHRIGFTNYPEKYMSAADICCLPSHREGFGSVLIEAAAVGIPAIASRIYGIVDAVEDGITGILHLPTSDCEIAKAMILFSSNEELRIQMGRAAHQRVIEKFSEQRITQLFSDFYNSILNKKISSCNYL